MSLPEGEGTVLHKLGERSSSTGQSQTEKSRGAMLEVGCIGSQLLPHQLKPHNCTMSSAFKRIENQQLDVANYGSKPLTVCKCRQSTIKSEIADRLSHASHSLGLPKRWTNTCY